MTNLPLYQHQDVELRQLLNSTAHRALHWEMGTGKTVIAARLFQGMRLAGQTGAMLYLCPTSLKQQVARELRRWGSPGLHIQILQTRRDKLNPSADVAICNYDLLLSNSLFEQLLTPLWLLLVIDESHLLRTPSAQRTRRVLGRKPCLAASAQRVLALTGTPIINSPLDIFPLVNRLFPHVIAVKDANDKWRRMTQTEYEDRYCTKRQIRVAGGRNINVISGGRNLNDLRQRIAPYVSRVRRDDVLDLPPIAINDFALAIETGDALDAAMAALPSALMQALHHADDNQLLHLVRQYTTELSSLRRLLGTLKAKAAAEHVLERLDGGEDRIIAFHHHRDVGDIMQAQLHIAGVSTAMLRGDTPFGARSRAIDALNDGTARVLLLQTQSGSLGLNLQIARYAVIVEPDWTDATTQQAISRIYRAGQTRSCVVEFLLIPNSLDEHVSRVARDKALLAASLIENPVMENAYGT